MIEKLLNIILDKINREGEDSLTFDERVFLKQHGEGSVNPELVDWLLDEDDSYDNFGDKLQYYVFNRDELHPYQNIQRTVNIINYNMGFDGEEHSDPDWGDSYVWLLKGNESSGIFLFYDVETPEIAIVKRTLDDDMGVYNNTDMETSRTVKTFYGLIDNAKKIKNNMENNKKTRIYEMIMLQENQSAMIYPVFVDKDSSKKIATFSADGIKEINNSLDRFNDFCAFVSKHYNAKCVNVSEREFMDSPDIYYLKEVHNIGEMLKIIHETYG